MHGTQAPIVEMPMFLLWGKGVNVNVMMPTKIGLYAFVLTCPQFAMNPAC